MTAVKAGARVKYIGSVEKFHGTGTVLSADNYDHPTVTSDDGHRYTLWMDAGTHLFNVRRQSFVEVTDETVLAEAEA